MSTPYEIKDSDHPTWRGMRFSTIEQARRELARAVGAPGRFYIVDRTTKQVVR